MKLQDREAVARMSLLRSSPPSFIEGKSRPTASSRASGGASGAITPLCRNRSNCNQLRLPWKSRRKEGMLTRRFARCATGWAHAPLWGEARQWLLHKETAMIRGFLSALPALARGLLSV